MIFKKGSIVRCINNKLVEHSLVMNTKYIIRRIDAEGYCDVEDIHRYRPFANGFVQKRFILDYEDYCQQIGIV